MLHFCTLDFLMSLYGMFYINEDPERAMEVTGLALDEIESIVGRFAAHSCRAGKLRGKVVILDQYVTIEKCFGKGILWTNQ